MLVALGAASSWHGAEPIVGADPHPVVSLWNGMVRFGTFTMTSSLLARLRLSLLHERALARTDPLTGAANGRTFYESVCLAVERSLRSARPLTLAYLDLDNFKQVNDRQGHAAGDEALRRVAHGPLDRGELTALERLGELGERLRRGVHSVSCSTRARGEGARGRGRRRQPADSPGGRNDQAGRCRSLQPRAHLSHAG